MSHPIGQQTSIHTFYAYIDPFLRPIREEDIGLLEFNGDEVEPFVMPRLGLFSSLLATLCCARTHVWPGKHYLETWADADQGIFPAPGHHDPAGPPTAPNPAFDPSQISNEDLIAEDVGHGPLTERVISALLPVVVSFYLCSAHIDLTRAAGGPRYMDFSESRRRCHDRPTWWLWCCGVEEGESACRRQEWIGGKTWWDTTISRHSGSQFSQCGQ